MANKNFELMLSSLNDINYNRPDRTNKLMKEEKYDNVDSTCLEKVKVSNEGKVYVDKEALPDLLKCSESDSEYIYRNEIREKDKKNFSGTDYAHSSVLVGVLDKRAQETRDTEVQAICKYSRDTLINIGDSDSVESKRRQFDGFAQKELPKLRKMRESDVDEITGEPLEKGYEFHHKNKKAIITDPEKLIDPDEGILVNKKTHKKIHIKKIVDEKQLEDLSEEIRNELKNDK